MQKQAVLREMDMATETAGGIMPVKVRLFSDLLEQAKKNLAMCNPAPSALQLGPPGHHCGYVFWPDGADEDISLTATAVLPQITKGGTAHDARDGLHRAQEGSCTTATAGETSQQLDLPLHMDPR